MPERPIMAAPNSPEVPRSAARVVERAEVEDSGNCDLVRNESGVLQMDVVDRRSEGPDDRERVHLLPEEVRWVQVRANDITDRRPQLEERRPVVDELQRVQLESDLDPVVGSLAGEVQPEPDHLVPLAAVEIDELIRPRVYRPAHGRRGFTVARTARHRDDGRDAEQLGEAKRVLNDRALFRRPSRMQEPGGAVEGRQMESALAHLTNQPGPRRGGAEQLRAVQMRCGGLSTRRDLDRVRPDPGGDVEDGRPFEMGERVRVKTELHRRLRPAHEGCDPPTFIRPT